MNTNRVPGSLRTLMIVTCLAAVAASGGTAFGISTKTVTAQPGGTLRVVIASGSIQITPWDRNEVRVNTASSDDDLSVSSSGNTVQIRSSSDLDLQVSVPKRFNLDVMSGSGDINISGSVEGTFKGKTSGGEVALRDFGGDININTGGGGVTCGDIYGKAKIHSAGGDIHLGKVSGEAVLETDGGDVDVSDVGKSIDARTSGGNITAGKVGGKARLMTSGGNIEVGPISGESDLESSGGNIAVHGAGGKVTATTSGGDLALEQIQGAFDGSTSAGNIDATVVGGKSGERCDGSLSSGGGNISLALPEDVNTTITAKVHDLDFSSDEEDQSEISSEFKADSYTKDDRAGTIVAVYRLNKGTGSITLDASGGSISIVKGKR